ncbi:MAG TPA: ABC transporter permease [Pyrinomonadaceae bacterium]|jgi:putative ABC transport system permease protein
MPEWKREIGKRLESLKLEPTREAEIVEELAQHLEDRYEELLSGGATLEEATSAALRELSEGGLLAEELGRVVREAAPSEAIVFGSKGRSNMLGDIWQDLRYGLRTMLKNPGFTGVAVLALALGIGANSAIFSVVNSILLRPLPFKDPDRLVMVWHSYPKLDLIAPVSPPGFTDYGARTDVFENAAVASGGSANLTGAGEPERIQARAVTASFFPTLGVTPALGRTFLQEEDQPSHEHVVVLSHGLWQRRFGADPAIVGQTIMLDGEGYNVVGVMPESFRMFGQDDLWAPLALTAEQLSPKRRGSEFLLMIARLKPGVSLEQAQAVMDTVAGQIRQNNPQNYPNDGSWGVKVKSVYEETVGDIRPALLVLLGAVGFVLLIACANVANLLLARASVRRKEIAIRTALGAGRRRLIRQLLTESVLLSLVGGGLGMVLAVWGVDVLVKLNQNNIPRAQEVGIDGRVLAFTCGLSLLTGILFGLAPALQASKTELTEALKEGGRTSGGSHRARVRNLLVISEIALALVLLIGAGLMVKSFSRLSHVNPGFEPQNLLTMQVALPSTKYSEPKRRADFYRQALEKIKTLPGVQSAGAVSHLPLSGSVGSGFFSIEGRAESPGEQLPHTDLRASTPDYLQTMGIPLLKGRYFNERDTEASPNVAIVDETLARRYWPNEDPIGKRISFNRRENADVWREVVGVVGAVRHKALDADYRGQLYFPHPQNPWGGMYLVVRTMNEPASMAAMVRDAIQSVDKDQPVYRVMTMETLLAESVAQRRFSMLLLTLFAVVAVLLAIVGLYGVMSYGVSQRTHEIGIRMALGAQAGDVLRMVVGQGLLLALIGVGAGLLASLALTRVMSSLLFGVSARDPFMFVSIPLILAAVALLACYIPARRATKVDPMIALRYE